MSAPEPTVVAAVEEVVSSEPPAAEVNEPKAEESAVEEVLAPAVEAEAEDPAKEVKAEGEAKKEASRNPSFLSKLFSFKGEKKSKAPKSPKKEKKKEEVEAVEAPATEEAPKEASAPEVPVEAVEAFKEVEAVAAEAATPEAAAASVCEEVKEEAPVSKGENKAKKVTRRLSARVGDFFKAKPKAEVTTPAKVDEYPPKIEETVRVAPLEAQLEAPASEGPKVEAAAPVVAATA